MVKAGDVITSHTGKQITVISVAADGESMWIRYNESGIEKSVCKCCKKHTKLFN